MRKYNLHIVEDDDVMRQTLIEVFAKKGFHVSSAGKGTDTLNFLKKKSVDIVLLDIRLPDMDGISVLKEIRDIDDSISVIVMTVYPEVKVAIAAIKAGAYDFINKPFELEELKLLVDKAVETQELKKENQRLRYRVGNECLFEMVGISPGMKRVKELILMVSKVEKTPVLIIGETGTGKELVANAVHCSSRRSGMPFININCSAIPENLLEAELFGYEKGAFTDARQTKKGILELADGGTIFLDEIGDMSLGLQPKLLRVLETHNFRRIGGLRNINIDVRVVAATNRNLKSLIKEGKFREDLYYRLNVMTIPIPPIRDRKEDILPLVERFIREYARAFGKEVHGIMPAVRDVLMNYQWPGNVREIKNIIERAMILTTSDMILPEYLPHELIEITGAVSLQNDGYPAMMTDNMTLEDIEKIYIRHIFNIVKGNKTLASSLLGTSRLTLRKKLKKYAIEYN